MQNIWAERVAELKASDQTQPSTKAWEAMDVLLLIGYLPRQTIPLISLLHEGSIRVQWPNETIWELSQDGDTIKISHGNDITTLPYLQGSAAITLESAQMGRKNARRRNAELANN